MFRGEFERTRSEPIWTHIFMQEQVHKEESLIFIVQNCFVKELEGFCAPYKKRQGGGDMRKGKCEGVDDEGS